MKNKLPEGWEIERVSEEIVMNEINTLIEEIKSKDPKVRYKALEEIMKLSRSNKSKQKKELLDILHKKASSSSWEERYVSMYAISRVMWRSGKFEDFQKAYYDVLRLLEDEDGRVRMAAFNALESFRGFFVMHVYGGLNHFNKEEIVKQWITSLISLWDKTKSSEQEKQQYFLMKCVDTLFRPDMEEYLSKKERCKYMEIWEKLQELNEEYNERGY